MKKKIPSFGGDLESKVTALFDDREDEAVEDLTAIFDDGDAEAGGDDEENTEKSNRKITKTAVTGEGVDPVKAYLKEIFNPARSISLM
ncbi:MAG: hypothetical protein P8130_12235 [Deltaproteobacteria bacterium]